MHPKNTLLLLVAATCSGTSRFSTFGEDFIRIASRFLPPLPSSFRLEKACICPLDGIEDGNECECLSEGRIRLLFLYRHEGTGASLRVRCEAPPRTIRYWICNEESSFSSVPVPYLPRRLLTGTDTEKRPFPTKEERIDYYVGSSSCPFKGPASETPVLHAPFLWTCGVTREGKIPSYSSDMRRLCTLSGMNRLRSRVRVWFGDLFDENGTQKRNISSHVITKSRLVTNRCGILLPLNMARHWPFRLLVRSKLHSTPWGEKKDSLVWRGVTTGEGVRRDFVHRLSERGHDVRFTRVVQGKDGWIGNATMHLGERISISAMLSRKYLLILPGNDVATGLKWALASNSVVLMPPPQKETWLMEGLLLPWVHYVPVGGPDLVEERLSWLRTHDEDAKRIVSAANEWMDSLLGSFFSPVKEALGHLYSSFESYSDPKRGLDELGIVRVCCRRMVLSHSHHVDDIAPYYSNQKRDLDENGTSLDSFCESTRVVSCD